MSPTNVVKVRPTYRQTQSLLMRLPHELRIIIYAFLFSSARFMSGKRCSHKLVVYRFISAPHGLTILLSCRQEYIEVGKSWVGQVLFCFETAKVMLDKLTGIPLKTLSMIRQIRVPGSPISICYRDDWKRYGTYQVLKLLPGLKLDRLTVCSYDDAQTSYNTLNRLAKYSDGWKELHYKSHTSGFLGYIPAWLNNLDEYNGENRFFGEPQPGGWQQKLEDRDGSISGASAIIYRSDTPHLDCSKPHISNASMWIKLTQALAPDQDIEDYRKAKDPQLKARGGLEKEALVVVKRDRGVDYEEKQGSPYLEAGDIREWFSGKTWAEITASKDELGSTTCRGVNYDDNRTKRKHVDVVDDHIHVDDYAWPHLLRWAY